MGKHISSFSYLSAILQDFLSGEILFEKDLSILDACEPYVNFERTNYGVRFYADAERLGMKINMNKKIKNLII